MKPIHGSLHKNKVKQIFMYLVYITRKNVLLISDFHANDLRNMLICKNRPMLPILRIMMLIFCTKFHSMLAYPE